MKRPISISAGIIIHLIIMAVATALQAEYVLNFFVGDVTVEDGARKIEPSIGMVLPPNAVIITGARSQAHLYDRQKNITVTINPDQRLGVTSIKKSREVSIHRTIFSFFRKDTKSLNKTVVMALRGAEEGKEDVEWADGGDGKKAKAADRTMEWDLFVKGHYAKVIAGTRGAKDDDGAFLNAASIYYLQGHGGADAAAAALEKLASGDAGSAIKSESCRILGAINFEQARYDRAFDCMRKAVKNTPDADIGETSYYILIKSGLATNRDEEAKEYLRKMRKHYPRSGLLGGLGEK
jgi:TolA-binding protein